ncbi:hypothetical protein AAF712_016178 [Marasmius tenuissimus]|uniref:Uncharacterized protein n=1 Tax=Marasmius tenuissimus TaxID=585030 RepID=A0ABR2Z6D5_9AGAR
MSQQDLYNVCKRWGLIMENSKKNGLFSLAIIKGDDGNVAKEQILCEASTGLNFNQYFKA